MKLGRRNFIKISSIGALNLSLFSVDGLATIPDLSPLEKNFIHPPDASKSSCYWWWFNGLVDEAGITRDMEEFRAKGMNRLLSY